MQHASQMKTKNKIFSKGWKFRLANRWVSKESLLQTDSKDRSLSR